MLKHRVVTVLTVAMLLLLIVLGFFTEVKWWAFLVVGLFWLGLTTWGSYDMRINYFLDTHTRSKDRKEKKIALTFDDGPHPVTEKILDLLKDHQAKATFFCIGRQIEKYPDIFKRIVEEGHTVGNHTFSHSTDFGFLSKGKVMGEIQKNNTLIFSLTGKKPLLFRPPFGITNPMVKKALSVTGHKAIGWSIRSLDTVINNENTIFRRVRNKVSPGGIILFHDTSAKTEIVVRDLLVYLKEEKYTVLPVDRLLNLKAYEC